MPSRIQRPPRAADPESAGPEPVRFGMIGSSSLVATRAVTPAIQATPKAELIASASLRNGDNYQSVLSHPEVEAVYLPLPNGLHREWVQRCAAAGKHVLCEKPLALTEADARAMTDACADAGVVLFEAYMTPFHPRSVAVNDLVASGALGQLRSGRASFTFHHRDPSDHRWDVALGGGALADVGIYCLTPLFEAATAIGDPAPERVGCRAVRTTGGVDATTVGTLDFARGFRADFECSFELPERQLLELAGTDGRVVVDHAFTPGPADHILEIQRSDGSVERIDTGGADPYRGMVDHFCALVRGIVRSRRPPAVSIAFAALCDRLRGSHDEWASSAGGPRRASRGLPFGGEDP